MTRKPANEDAPAKRRGTRNAPIIAPETAARQLLRIGLHRKQVRALLRETALIRHLLRERNLAPTVQAQRAALQTMVESADQALAAYGKAADLIDKAGLGMALRERLDRAAGQPTGGELDDLQDQLIAARMHAAAALSAMPKAQRRVREPTLQIERIHAITGMPPKHEPRSKFRRIVEILYAEAGHSFKNPEAAIRNYAKRIKEGSS